MFSFQTIAPKAPCREARGLLEAAVLEGEREAQYP